MTRHRILWIGDALVPSGFARVTHYLCHALHAAHDVTVLGSNYHGDPPQPVYPVYPAYPGGDQWGVGRTREMVTRIKPSLVFVLQDVWNVPMFQREIGGVPTVAVLGVDGMNCRGAALNGLAHAIFWTEFGRHEAQRGGYTGESSVIPLGVDRTIYRPMVRPLMRDRLNVTSVLAERGCEPSAFIVGVVGKNQERKRLDLSIKYFAEWVHSRQIGDAFLWIHSTPTNDTAYDVMQLAHYYRIANRVIYPNLDPKHGVSEDDLARIYNVFDAGLTTTQGEGFGLTALEMMACGLPVVAPAWAALAEVMRDAACLVPCTETAVTGKRINTVGGIADRTATVDALDKLYRDRVFRREIGDAAYARACESQFEWSVIGSRYVDLVSTLLGASDGHAVQAAMEIEVTTS